MARRVAHYTLRINGRALYRAKDFIKTKRQAYEKSLRIL